MAMTGNGELGFDSGEGAWEMATTSKEGSRRANYPFLKQGGSDKKYRWLAFYVNNRNERCLHNNASNNWRASLVPAAAVIPAPIAYIKVVAVKTLVVEVLSLLLLPKRFGLSGCTLSTASTEVQCYFEKIRVFQAGLCQNIQAWNNSSRPLCWLLVCQTWSYG